MKKISIIILTWNGIEYTKKCLESLKDNTEYSDYETIVVDNGSKDGTLEYLETLDWITLIKNEKNEGFVRGNNIGLKYTDNNDVVFLNNDIIITQKDWLEKLNSEAYKSNETGLVGCRLINEKNEFLHAGTVIYTETYWGQQIGGGTKDIGQYGLNREVDGVVFACAYVKREVIDKIGGLNEDYFSYFEDTDYCYKVKEAGYKCVYCGEVTLIHYQNVSTNINEVNFSDMFKKSQKIFKGNWDEKLKDRYNNGISWHSIVNFPSGYAVSSKNLMIALDSLNVDVRYKYVYGSGTPFPVKEPEMSDNYTINVIRGRKFSKSYPQVTYGQGDIFYKNTGKYKIGYTMLETTGIPKEWVKQANEMNEIWVPSQFNVETFVNSGVKTPIHVIPLGVDINFFNPRIKSYKKHNKFTFLSIFEWGERKAPEKLLRAFASEFGRNEDVVLICKVINNDSSINVENEISKLNLPDDSPEIIFLYNQNIPGYQMGTLYKSADCFVLPTRGEGWGMPILEAMACGIPTIATGWSSQLDFINDNNGYLLKTKGLIDAKAKCPYYDGFKWADPDEEHLMYLMRHVYENREEAIKKGNIAAEEVAEKWTWEMAAKKIITRLNQIEK
jgi:Predicted glycosyltransferases